MNLSLQFRAAALELGGETHLRECLKQHFADICSDDDIILHKFLDSSMSVTDIQALSLQYDSQEAVLRIVRTLKNWRLHKRCIINPWWAC